MKKSLCVFFKAAALCAALLCLFALLLTAGADDVFSGECGEGVFWRLDSAGVLTVYGAGETDDFFVGAPWEDLKDSVLEIVIEDGVTYIGGFAFAGCEKAARVSFGAGVSAVGQSAFEGCTSLSSLSIPDGVLLLDDFSFSGCTSLESLSLGAGVDMVGQYAFSGCTALCDLSFEEGLREIGAFAFEGCTALSSLSIPDSVESVGIFAFCGCTSLESVSADGEALIKIGQGAFSDCAALSRVALPDRLVSLEHDVFANTAIYNDPSNWENGVLYIGAHLIKADTAISGAYTVKEGTKTIAGDAFIICASLKSIDMGDSLLSVGSFAFYRCTNLNTVYFGDSLEKIDIYAFYECPRLITAPLPESLKTIGQSAFGYCTQLQRADLGDNVAEIGDSAFRGCTALSYVTVGAGLKEGLYSSLFTECPHLLEINVSGENTSYASEKGVLFNKEKTKIIMCPTAKKGVYTIPDGVLSVENSAFSGCASLTGVNIPESVNKIGYAAFTNCAAITGITIPDGIAAIGDYTFLGCASLEIVTVPDSVKSVGQRAFDGTALEKNPENRENGVFYIGKYLISAEKTVSGALSVKEGTVVIADGAFYDCRELSSVTLPDSVEIIGNAAFNTCKGLESLILGKGVKKIGEYAFFNCVSLNGATFCGTASQWKKVEVSDGNEPLTYAVYAAFKEWSFSVSENLLTVTETPADGVIFASFYDLSGKMTGVKRVLLNEAEEIADKACIIKLFVTGDDFTPSCAATQAEIKTSSVIVDEQGNAWSPVF